MDKAQEQMAAIKERIRAEVELRTSELVTAKPGKNLPAVPFAPGNKLWQNRKRAGRLPGWYRALNLAEQAAPSAMKTIIELAQGLRVDPKDPRSRWLQPPNDDCARYVVDRVCGKPIQPVDVREVLATLSPDQVENYIKQAIGVLGYGKESET